MMILIIFLFIILLFVPIGIRVIYDDKRSDIDIYLFSFIRHKFDLDEFIRKFIIDENKKVSIRVLLNNLEIALNSQNIIKDICSKTRVKKSTIILKQNYTDIYKFIFFWNIVSRVSYLFKNSFKSIENEYYMITNSNSELNFEFIFKINIWKMLFIIIKNINEVKSIIKVRRRQKKSGTSNL